VIKALLAFFLGLVTAITTTEGNRTDASRGQDVQKSLSEALKVLMTLPPGSAEHTELSQGVKNLMQEVEKSLNYFQDEETFNSRYSEFMATTGRQTRVTFSVDNWSFKAYNLYMEVITHGGYLHISHEMSWDRVWTRVPKERRTTFYSRTPNTTVSDEVVLDSEIPFTMETENELKDLYITYLYPYEFHQRKMFV